MGDKVWTVSNYEDTYLGRTDLETGTVTSDNSVYAQLTLLVGANRVAKVARELGVQSPLSPYFAIGLGRRGGEPARAGARLRDVRERRPAHRRVDLRQPAARDP